MSKLTSEELNERWDNLRADLYKLLQDSVNGNIDQNNVGVAIPEWFVKLCIMVSTAAVQSGATPIQETDND